MMAEQKGRGGKKPKYQIADIGGPDLTAQDISTERVLNFLIKGETPTDQGAGTASDGLDGTAPSREQTVAGRADEAADASLPPPAAQSKKSLDHLFRRASVGAAAKDLKLDLRGKEEPAAPAVETEAGPDLASRPAEAATAEAGLTSSAPQASPPAEPAARPQIAEPQTLTPEVPAAVVPLESAELTQLISLWKSFYRLKDGEIEALGTMYRMSHGLGADQCHVKMHKLAEMSNLTYRYCQKVVRSLEQLGWITKLQDYDPSTQLGVLYRVNLKPAV